MFQLTLKSLKKLLTVLDIGSITYSDVEIDTYAIDGSLDARELEENFEEALY